MPRPSSRGPSPGCPREEGTLLFSLLIMIPMCHPLATGRPPDPHSAARPTSSTLALCLHASFLSTALLPVQFHAPGKQKGGFVPEPRAVSGVRDRGLRPRNSLCSFKKSFQRPGKKPDGPAKPLGESHSQLGPMAGVSPAPRAAGRNIRPERQSWGGAKAQSGGGGGWRTTS